MSGSGARAGSADDAAGLDTGCRNLQWSLALLDGMTEAGLHRLVLSPGARSTPLVIAARCLEQAGRLRLTPVLDERSAAFFALGLARASLQPVALLATSGSAPAHWYPAVIEASQARLPLLLLSADRPPRLRGWGANQTIDQQRLFGAFVREFHDPGPPQPGAAALKAQRALGRRAAEVSRGRCPGPVHLNLPFDEPLVPGPDCQAELAGCLCPSPDRQPADARPSADQATPPEGDPISPTLIAEAPAERGAGRRSVTRRIATGRIATGRIATGRIATGRIAKDVTGRAAEERITPDHTLDQAATAPEEADNPAADTSAASASIGSAPPTEAEQEPIAERRLLSGRVDGPLTLSGWPAGRGLLVCGPGADRSLGGSASSGGLDGLDGLDGLRASLWRFAEILALPVLADPLSGLRAGPGSQARVSGYDALLRNPEAARALRPDWVLRIGQFPVSKVLGQWLEGVPAILIDDAGGWSDPGHDLLARLELPAAAVCEALAAQRLVVPDREWLERWCTAERNAWEIVDRHAQPPASEASDDDQRPWDEGQVLRTLRRWMADGEALFCANSMPIRQIDTWWRGGGPRVDLVGNRGASGIDGYLSTLAGLSAAGLHCWGLTGDLSFCHDLGGLTLAARLDRPLLVLNNGGGHIFDYLPQRDLPDFERLWRTPQPLAIGALAALAGLRHWQVQDGDGLEQALAEIGPGPGVIEVRIDPERSRENHRALWACLAEASLLGE